MSFFLKNITGGSVDINDLGVTVSAGSNYNLADANASDVVYSVLQASGDLSVLINAGDIVALDPSDGITELSTANSLLALQQYNNPHYGMPVNAYVGDIEDVTLTSPENKDVLEYFNGVWKNTPVTNSVPVICQAHSTTTPSITTSWANIPLGSVDIETDVNVIEFNDITTAGFTLKELGWYEVKYNVIGQESIACRAVLNGTTTVIDGSETAISGDILDNPSAVDINSNNTCIFYYQVLTANTDIDIQMQGQSGGTLLSATVSINKMSAVTGTIGSAQVAVGILPPTDPTEGTLWWNSSEVDGGTMYMWYVNGLGNTPSWVPATVNGLDGADGATGTTGADGADGADGTNGVDGTNGTDGNTILSGTDIPSSQGVDGDYYLKTDVSVLYGPKTGGSWVSSISLIGATGTTGDTGATGADGNTILNGTAVPTAEGVDGDFYLKTNSSDLYGPKIGTSWGLPTSLIGTGGATWSNVSTSITLSSGVKYFADSSSSALTLTMPASPINGSEVVIHDATGSAATNNITIGRGTNTIMGLADDYVIDTNNQTVTLSWYDVTSDWRITGVTA